MCTRQGSQDVVRSVSACQLPSVQKARPHQARTGRAVPMKGNLRTCCRATMSLAGVFSTALKPSDPSIPQHREGTQLPPGHWIQKTNVHPLYFQGKYKSLFCSSGEKTRYFYSCFYPASNNIFLGEKYLSYSPEGFLTYSSISPRGLSMLFLWCRHAARPSWVPGGQISVLKRCRFSPMQKQKGKGLGSDASKFQLCPWPRQHCGWTEKAKRTDAAAAEITGKEHLGHSCSEAGYTLRIPVLLFCRNRILCMEKTVHHGL